MADDVKNWMQIKELQERNRCIKCKKRLDEFVMCERCLEFKYCCIQCLEDDRHHHLTFCNVIGLMKGRLHRLTDEEGQRLQKVKEKAKLLNEDGTLRTPGTSLSEAGTVHEISSQQEDNDEIQVAAGKPKSRQLQKNNTREHGKHQDSGSSGPKVTEQNEKVSEDTAVKLSIAGGQFGGAVTADQKVQSGESFGKGWWRTWKAESQTGQTSTDSNGGSVGDNKDKPSNTNEEHKATSSPTTASPTHIPLEEALSGLEIVKYDPKQAEERSDSSKGSSTLGKCSFCLKEGPVLKCSRCKMASYCGKNCQKSDYKKHSNTCKLKERFDIALSKVPRKLKVLRVLFMGSFDVSPFLATLPDEFEFMLLRPRSQVMVEIVDEHPHPFRYGAIVRDLMGQATQVLFYTDSPFYMHMTPGPFGLNVPIPLSMCIQPGNFILLLDAHWHYFMDGTRGIRVDDLGDVCFIFMEK